MESSNTECYTVKRMKLVPANVGDVADRRNVVNEVAGDFLGGEFFLVKVAMREKDTSRSNNVLIKQV